MFKQYSKQVRTMPVFNDNHYHRDARSHRDRIMDELTAAGVTRYGRWKLESKYLPTIIHPDEHIMAVVYGNSEAGSVMLVATERRVIYLDKKPFFVNEDEITYDVVSGVQHSSGGFMSTVTLHTRIKDYTIDTINDVAADRFVTYIEARCLEQASERGRDDFHIANWVL